MAYVSDLEGDGAAPIAPQQQQAPAQPYASDLEDLNFGKSQQQAPAPSWSQVPQQALSNVPHSALEFGKNMVQPILHPIDTATGIKNIGQGVMEKLGITEGDAHVKYADAVGQLLYNRWGSEENIRKSLAEDPVGMAGDISMLLSGGETALARVPGILGKVGEAAGTTARVLDPISTLATKGISKVAGVGKDIEPSTRELRKAADDNYKVMRSLPVEIHPWAMDALADDIKYTLESPQHGFRDYNQPSTFRAIEELRQPAGPYTTISDIDGVRQVLNRAGNNRQERAAANEAKNMIDDYLATNIQPNQVASGHHLLDDLRREASEARGNYAAASRSELIDTAQRKAGRQAGRAYSGTNIDNATRQKVDALLNNEKKMRGFNPEESAVLDKVVRGGPKTLRKIAKYAPTGPFATATAAGTGFLAAGPIGAAVMPGVGYAAKIAADAITAHRLDRASRLVRSRSPLGQQRVANPPSGTGRASLIPAQTSQQVGRLENQPERLYVSPNREQAPLEASGGRIARALRAVRKH